MSPVTKISFEETNRFRKIFCDYVSGAESLLPFYTFAPGDEGYRAAAGAIRFDEKIRLVLVNTIRQQYADTGISPGENLVAKLEQPGTLTVCTGHQLCLFTGPLYFIYKIITTIRVAEEQSEKLKKNIVPVYWMASEDHDFEEISAVHLFGKTLQWETVERGPAGRMKTDSLQPLLAEMEQLVGTGVQAELLKNILTRAYAPGCTLAQATRRLVHELFDGKILVLDADDAALKKIFIPVMQDDVATHYAEQLVLETSALLEKNNYDIQVHPRTVNLFYMKGNVRERMEMKDGKYTVLNTDYSFSKAELENEIQQHPEYFSPNVVLRPVYQQIILPNIAYIGGPGEISYWLQYKKMFEKFAVFFPLLQPRHFAMLADKNSQAKLEKAGVTPVMLFGEIENLVKEIVQRNANVDVEQEKKSLAEIYDALRQKAVAADPTLKGFVDAELQKQLHALGNIETKILRAEKQKQETSVNQLRKLHDKFFPEGELQERYDNFIPFFLLYGKNFFDILRENFDFPVDGMRFIAL